MSGQGRMTLKEYAYAHRVSYRTAKRMLRDGRLRRVPGPLLRGFEVEAVPLCPLRPIAVMEHRNILTT